MGAGFRDESWSEAKLPSAGTVPEKRGRDGSAADLGWELLWKLICTRHRPLPVCGTLVHAPLEGCSTVPLLSEETHLPWYRCRLDWEAGLGRDQPCSCCCSAELGWANSVSTKVSRAWHCCILCVKYPLMVKPAFRWHWEIDLQSWPGMTISHTVPQVNVNFKLKSSKVFIKAYCESFLKKDQRKHCKKCLKSS